jgi:hypothetical protein
MKASPILWVVLLAVACAHPHRAENASQEASGGERAAADAGPASEASPAANSKASGNVLGGSGGVTDPSGTPLGTSENALLQPGAERQVREKLGLPEHGGSLHQPLMKFQREHDLPATGILDHATARALGLDPDQIFRKSGSN